MKIMLERPDYAKNFASTIYSSLVPDKLNFWYKVKIREYCVKNGFFFLSTEWIRIFISVFLYLYP